MRREICVVMAALSAVCFPAAAQCPYFVFWNLENYFDPFDDPETLDDEYTPDGYRHWTWYKFTQKRNMISKTLISMRDTYGDYPLVAAFAEVENAMVLRQLTEHTPLAKLGYGIVHRDSPDSRGIDVALIYRHEFFRVIGVAAYAVNTSRDRPTRDILYVCGEVLVPYGGPDTVCILVNHWPSKFGGEEYSRPFRQAASDRLAQAVNHLRDSLGSGVAIIAAGDFNDTPDSVPVRSLLSATGMECPALPLHNDGQGTLKYNGRWELIDLFMVSGPDPGFDMRIYRHPLLLEKDEKFLGVKPFRSYYGPLWHGGASDHLPIVLLLGSTL